MENSLILTSLIVIHIWLTLLQRVRLAQFGRHNFYQLLSDITGMLDISLPFILLYDCNNFIWSFRFFKCIII